MRSKRALEGTEYHEFGRVMAAIWYGASCQIRCGVALFGIPLICALPSATLYVLDASH